MSQNSLVLPTSGTLSGLAAVQAINNAVDTLNTLASGGSAPSSPEAGQFWHDTTNKQIKIRSMDNTTWIPVGTLDETAYTFKAAGLASTLGITGGGTGATTQAAALAALLASSTIPQANIGGNFTFSGTSSAWYMKIPYGTGSAGLIIQGGTTGALPNGTNSVTLPTTFPTGSLAFSLVFNASSNIANAEFTLINGGTSNFGVFNQSGGTASLTYIAIGN